MEENIVSQLEIDCESFRNYNQALTEEISEFGREIKSMESQNIQLEKKLENERREFDRAVREALIALGENKDSSSDLDKLKKALKKAVFDTNWLSQRNVELTRENEATQSLEATKSLNISRKNSFEHQPRTRKDYLLKGVIQGLKKYEK